MVTQLDSEEWDVYFSTCLAGKPGKSGQGCSRMKAEAVTVIPAFFIDLDTRDERHLDCPATVEEGLAALEKLPVTPSLIVHSGGGLHVYWLLSKPLMIESPNGLEEVKHLMKRFAYAVKSFTGYTSMDAHASEPARVLRVPGTHNRKQQPLRPVELLETDGPIYTLQMLTAFADQFAPSQEAAPSRTATPSTASKTTSPPYLTFEQRFDAAKRNPAFFRLYSGDWGGYPSMSEAELAFCNKAAFYFAGDPNAIDKVYRQSALVRPKWDERHGVRTYGEMTIAKAIEGTDAMYEQKRPRGAPAKPPAASSNAATPSSILDEETVFTSFERAYAAVPGYSAVHGQAAGQKAVGGELVPVPLANFAALIEEEITRDDGAEVRKEFIIKGVTSTGAPLRQIALPAARFGGMGWPVDVWGADANIFPGTTCKDKLRFVIQEASRPTMKRREVLAHSGWRQVDGKQAFLYHGGAIGVEGPTVELEGNLSAYALPPVVDDLKLATGASKAILDYLPLNIGIPLLAHMYLAPLYPFMEQNGNAPAYILFLSGSTGTRKSTVAALALSHFGAEFRAKQPPASFADTVNSIRRKGFILKDVPLLIDDLHPTADVVERRRMVATVQAIARAWGDRSERGRMQADLTLQTAQPPRGLCMITGEDLPDVGESGTARFYMVEVREGDVPTGGQLTELQRQARKGLPAQAMRGYIEWLSHQAETLPDQLETLFTQYRERAYAKLPGAHGRLYEAVAFLMVGFYTALEYWQAVGCIIEPQRLQLWKACEEHLLKNVDTQRQDMRMEEPTGMFFSALRELFATQKTHLHDLDTVMSTPLPGELIGYQDKQFIYLLPGVAFGAVQEHLRAQGTVFPITKAQLWKRLLERNMVYSQDRQPTRMKRISSQTAPQRLLWVHKAALEGGYQQTMEAKEG